VNLRRLRPPAPLAALLAVAFILGTTWATLTPAFQAPDENSHTAYAQILAESFKLPGIAGRPGQSTEQRTAATAVNADQVAGVLLTRPDWSQAAQDRWERLDAALGGQARKDGGGPNPASPNPPLSYVADAAAYRVVGGDLFTRLWAMRMTSVLAFLVAVLAAWLLAGEVFARDRLLQLAAAGTIALQPMVGFLAGAVMPDVLVIALSTLALWLGTRVLKRGLTLQDGLALGVVVGAACVTKSASFVLLPAALLAVVVGAVRARRAGAAAAPGVLAAGAGIVATLGAWIVVARVIGRSAAAQVQGTATNAGGLNLREFGSYLWQFYLPKLSFQTPFPRTSDDIPVFQYWVKGLWADFGWLEVHFGDPVYFVIAGAMVLVAVLAVTALVRLRSRVDWVLAAFFLLLAVTTIAGLHWTEYRQFTGGATSFIQGRYLLPLAGIGGLAVALALRQFGYRTRALMAAVWLAAMFALTLFSLGLNWERFYA
jgi:4-amino-4-deoxy-L-arabinose transferase-like glycosyltransferase